MTEDNAKIKAALEIKSQELDIVKHRIDNLDITNIDGTPQQRFNAMIRLFAVKSGIQFK